MFMEDVVRDIVADLSRRSSLGTRFQLHQYS
jgi:GTP cyclohydrolase FolE2